MLAATAGEARAQAYTPPPPPLVPGPCKPTKNEPCDTQPAKAPAIPATADKFPFPGEAPAGTTQPQTGTAPDAKPAAGQFPFPGNAAEAPAAAANSTPDAKKPAFPFPDEPGESSSSSSSSSSSASGEAADPDGTKGPLKDAGSTGSTRFQRKHLAKVEDLDHRELEDLDVSHYYITTGNFVAAYSRAQDAVKLYPDDENAHMALAVAADKLKKKDEAAAEYQAYLKLAPDGEKAKQAERALELLAKK